MVRQCLSKWHVIRSVVKSLPYQYGYLFLLYFLEMEDYIESNWQFYSLAFFLIPISIIIIFFDFIFCRGSNITNVLIKKIDSLTASTNFFRVTSLIITAL